MKTPQWNFYHLESLLFHPDADRATRLAAGLRSAGLPVQVTASSTDALSAARRKYFRTLVVAVDLQDSHGLTWLDQLRRAASRGWLIALAPRTDDESLDIAHLHGVDALLARPVVLSELIDRMSSFQILSRPTY